MFKNYTKLETNKIINNVCCSIVKNGFSDKLGFNHYKINTSKAGDYSHGGLFFYDIRNILKHVKNFQTDIIFIIELVKESLVFRDNTKRTPTFITNKYIVKKILNINNFYFDDYIDDEIFFYSILKEHGKNIKFFRNQNKELCEYVLNKNGLHIKYIREENRTHYLLKLACTENGKALEFIKNQRKDLIILALDTNRDAVFYVKKYTIKTFIFIFNNSSIWVHALPQPNDNFKFIFAVIDKVSLDYLISYYKRNNFKKSMSYYTF
jgi:hypothetical protein